MDEFIEYCEREQIKMNDKVCNRWIYIIRYGLNEQKLNEYGNQGWELCHITPYDNTRATRAFYFKKSVPEKDDEYLGIV